MYTPNPILLAETPAAGFTLLVSAGRGGLAGLILLGTSGPPASVEVSADGATWQAPTYPHTLAAGEMLRLTRTDASPTLTTLRALAPLDEGLPPEPETPGAGPYTVSTDPEGYQTLTNADATTDADGYQTLPDATATADSEGYESVERSTP